jgi:hypothetical protein
MTGNGEHGQPARKRVEQTAAESARPAWAKPVIRRFSLARTLAGSGVFNDGGAVHQPTPT